MKLLNLQASQDDLCARHMASGSGKVNTAVPLCDWAAGPALARPVT